MEKITIYRSFDGKIFLDDLSCYLHEIKISHKSFYHVDFFDENLQSIKPEMEDNLYNKCVQMTIHNQEELNDIMFITEEFGWCEWEQINSVGKWIRQPISMFEGVWHKEE